MPAACSALPLSRLPNKRAELLCAEVHRASRRTDTRAAVGTRTRCPEAHVRPPSCHRRGADTRLPGERRAGWGCRVVLQPISGWPASLTALPEFVISDLSSRVRKYLLPPSSPAGRAAPSDQSPGQCGRARLSWTLTHVHSVHGPETETQEPLKSVHSLHTTFECTSNYTTWRKTLQ